MDRELAGNSNNYRPMSFVVRDWWRFVISIVCCGNKVATVLGTKVWGTCARLFGNDSSIWFKVGSRYQALLEMRLFQGLSALAGKFITVLPTACWNRLV